jgi:hypothetical protein
MSLEAIAVQVMVLDTVGAEAMEEELLQVTVIFKTLCLFLQIHQKLKN